MSEQNNKESEAQQDGHAMESLHRVYKIPVIESTINKASEVYGRIKDSSEVIGNVLTSAENASTMALKKATEVAQPVTEKLQGPIKRVDSALCTGLDYIEEKVPAIKLPPNELAQKTKEAIKTAGEYGKEKLNSALSKQDNSKEEDKKT